MEGFIFIKNNKILRGVFSKANKNINLSEYPSVKRPIKT
jgi:hypothetical protein